MASTKQTNAHVLILNVDMSCAILLTPLKCSLHKYISRRWFRINTVNSGSFNDDIRTSWFQMDQFSPKADTYDDISIFATIFSIFLLKQEITIIKIMQHRYSFIALTMINMLQMSIEFLKRITITICIYIDTLWRLFLVEMLMFNLYRRIFNLITLRLELYACIMMFSCSAN